MSTASQGEPVEGDVAAASPEARVHAVLLAVSAAAFTLACLILRALPEGISEKEEGSIFVFSCLMVPLAGVAASVLFDGVKKRWFTTHRLFYPVLALAHAIFWAVIVHRLREVPTPPGKGAVVELLPHFRTLVVWWVAGNLILLALLAATRGRWFGASTHPLLALLVRWIDHGLPVVIVVALLPFASRTPLSNSILTLLAIGGAATFVHAELASFPRQRSARFAFDALVLVGIALLVFDPVFDADVYHHNFYLGPVAAVRGGRSLLVDVNCQYGVGVIYFIGAVFDLNLRFVPPTIAGFAALINILGMVGYIVLYATLRSITRSVLLPALVLALIVIVPRFEQYGFPSMYPSTGAVRFLPGYLLVGCFALRGRLPRHRAWVFVLEALVVGVSSVWSLESFVYVSVAYLASLVYETAHVKRSWIRRELQARIVPTAVAVVVSHISLAVFTYLRAGDWPHWWRYLDYIRLYSTKEFGTLPVEPWTPWLIIAGAYVVSVVALGVRRITLEKADLKHEYAVVFAMSALGIGQFTYYVGRSHLYNLFHICAPAFFVAGYWFIAAARALPRASQPFRQSFVFACYGAVVFCVLTAIPDVMQKFDHTWLSFVMTGREWVEKPAAPRAVEAAQLMRRHAANARRVAFTSTSDLQVETYLLVRKTSVWPLSFPAQDELIPEAKERIFSTPTGLKVGDVVFVDTGSPEAVDPAHVRLVNGVNPIDLALWNGLAVSFGFEVVEARPSGMVALRLTAK